MQERRRALKWRILMYFGRLQWNFLGREVTFEGSDLDISEKPAAIVAAAVVTNREPLYALFTGGRGALEEYDLDFTKGWRYRLQWDISL